MVPSLSPEGFESPDLGLNVVSLQVKVHPFFRDLLVVRVLKQDAILGVRQPK